MLSLHKRIKQIRGDMSREEFSRIVGISQRALITYEQNERTPKADVIYRICAETNVAPEWLVMGSGPMVKAALPTPSDTADSEKMADMSVIKKNQHPEIIKQAQKKMADRQPTGQESTNALQQELREQDKEIRELLRENGDLRVDIERKKARIAELERELARLLKGDETPPVAEVG